MSFTEQKRTRDGERFAPPLPNCERVRTASFTRSWRWL